MKHLHPKIQALRNKVPAGLKRSLPVTLSKSLSVRADGTMVEEGFVEGYACVWGLADSYGTVWVRGCFAKSIAERGPQSQSKQKIAFLWQHLIKEPIGQLVELVEDDYGLRFKAKYDDFDAVPMAKRCNSQIRSGTLNQFSFGFEYLWDKMEYDETHDVILIKEAELEEISPVTFGAQSETYAFRSTEDVQAAIEALEYDTADALEGLPRYKRLEIRELISRHVSLSRARLNVDTQPKSEKGKKGAIDYSYLNKNLSL
jgi:uncharacterized protein